MNTNRVVLLVDSTYSLRMVAAFEKIAEALPLSYKVISYNIGSASKWLTAKIGSTGKELKTLIADESKRKDFDSLLAKLSSTYSTKVFIIASEVANLFVSGYQSLDKTRGSRYDYRGFNCFVIDKLDKPYIINYGKWVAQQDLLKVNRFVTDKARPFPKFKYKADRQFIK